MNKSSVTNVYMCDILTDQVLKDVCNRITGQQDFTVDFVGNDYDLLRGGLCPA